MQDKWKWLAVPPALALLLFFGPWRNTPPQSVEVDAPRTATKDPRPAAVPGTWQVLSTVFGLCLLGTAVVLGLARVRRNAQSTPGNVVILRQSLRLSNRHAVHAVQFDDQILLLGECDASLRVLQASADPDVAAAEAAAARASTRDERNDDDEGAVLKDMVIPRPPQGVARPAKPARSASPALSDFRTLLKKANVEV